MKLDELYSSLTIKTGAKLALIVLDGLGDIATAATGNMTPLEPEDRRKRSWQGISQIERALPNGVGKPHERKCSGREFKGTLAGPWVAVFGCIVANR